MSDARDLMSDVEIPCAHGVLHCAVASPAETPWARLLIVHGYGEHVGRYAEWMRWLAARGVACEAVDLRGHGKSPGRRGFVSRWEEYLEDLEVFLQPRPATQQASTSTPLFIMGHSHGGLITVAAGERGILSRAGARGCILSSPYLDTRLRTPAHKRLLAYAVNHVVPWLRVPSGLTGDLRSSDPEMLAEDRADPLMSRTATPRWYITMRATQARVLREAEHFTLPFLCVIGEADVIADPLTAAHFYRRSASPDKSIYVYPSRLHELFRETGRQRVFADVLAWVRARGGARNGGLAARKI